jgi:fermentation-respiration switch protein FrsA (DUF1100 family)
MSDALIGAGVLLILYTVVVTVLFLLQRRILYLPDDTTPDLARAGVPGVRLMNVPTPDGMSLLAWYMPPMRDDAHVVLYLHGNAGNIGHRTYRLGPYNRLGWGVLLLEYRGYGGNPGSPSESGLLTDARAGLAALVAMGFPLNRILLWGESLGSGLAVRLATEHSVAAVLLEAPYTSITDMAQLRFPFAPAGWLLQDRFESSRIIGSVRAPVLVMHGERDRIVPVTMGRTLYEAAAQPKELWIAPEAGHVNLVEAGAIEAAAAFVSRMDMNSTG